MKKITLFLLFIVSITASSQEKKTYDIGILIDFKSLELTPLLDELKSEIIAVIGEDAKIRFSDEHMLSNDMDLVKAEANYQSLLTSEIDIILAFGIINNAIINKQSIFPKPTILFGAVNEDFISIDKENLTTGTPNLTYLIASKSHKKDLATFKELTGFKRVGIIVQQPLLNIFDYEAFFDAEIENLNATYTLIPFNSYADIEPNLNDIDAVYIAEGFYLSDAEMKALATECIRLKLPSFTTNSVDDVRKGILATNQAEQNLNQFFRRIALTVERYVGGAELADLPTYISFDADLTINYNTAELIGLPLKYSLIAKTNFLGDFDKKVSEKEYNIVQVMNDVLVNNLPLQSSQKEVDLSEKDVQAAWTNYLPSITANTSATYLDPKLAEASMGLNPEYSTDGNITLSQTLFSPDANANIKTQKDLLESQRQNFSADQLDALFDASNAYFNALILKANLQIIATNLNLTKKNLQIAQENYEAGQAGKSDVLRFRSELAQDMQALVEASNSLEQGFFTLNQILNNPLDYNIDVDEVELEEGLYEEYSYTQLRELVDDPRMRKSFVDFLIEEAKANAPELKSLDYNIAAIGRSINLNTGGRFLPTLALQGQYNKNFNQWGIGVNPNALDKNYNVGLNLSIPIVDQNRKNINRQVAIIQKDQLTINKTNTQLAIETNVNNAVLAIINEVSNIALSTVSETAAAEALDLTQTSYSNGAVSVVQLIDAQNNYLNSSLAKATAVYNYLLSSLRLERFIGYYFLMHSRAENDQFIGRFTAFFENNNN
jgi:outer membrane protein TolC